MKKTISRGNPGTDHVFCLPCSAGGQGDLSPKHSGKIRGQITLFACPAPQEARVTCPPSTRGQSPWFIALALLAMTFLLGCASNLPVTVEARISEPADLTALPTDERRVTIAISQTVESSEATGEEANVYTLTPTGDENIYAGDIPSMEKGTYGAEVCIWYPLPSSDTPVAIAGVDIVITGQERIELTLRPGDFTVTIDDDGDGATNLSEVVGLTDPFDPDTDGDGLFDGSDIFPSLSSETGDSDGDGIGDNSDNCAGDSNADQLDTDDDGRGDLCDTDDDNDGVADAEEGTLGTDPLTADTDEDESSDGTDNCPAVANPNQLDSDSDGDGDACDTDDDNDGILDANDNCPYLASSDQTDSDDDGVGDECTDDNDGDEVLDAVDNCPTVSNADKTDTDLDTTGDACDTDDDNDGFSDVEEKTPGVDNLITVTTSWDTDGDGVPDSADNCPITDNIQADADGDGEGDACDCDLTSSTIKTTNAIFVSSTTGDDANSGARNDPVRTIQRGINLAVSSGRSAVYVASGSYEGAITMANGISIHGGFSLREDDSLCDKSLYDDGVEVNLTEITSISSPVVLFSDIVSETRLEGMTVRSAATSGNPSVIDILSTEPSSENNIIIQNSYITAPGIPDADVTAVDISNASPVFINNIIDAGDSSVTTAIELINSPAPKFFHNTISGGGSSVSSTVVSSSGSSPVLVNNILFTDGGDSQKIIYIRDLTPPPETVVKNNILFGISDPASDDEPHLYRGLATAYTTIADVNAIEGDFSGNIQFSGDLSLLFAGAAGGNFRLADGAVAIDEGMVIESILTDRDGFERGIPPDPGAFEGGR